MDNMHGGNRPGSGRKKKPPTKTVTFRVDKGLIERLKKIYGRKLNAKIVEILKGLDEETK